MKLGTALLRDGIISLSQLEAALRSQILYGGRLGTNLVELGFVDLDTLGSYLSQLFGLPAATKNRLEAAPRSALTEFGGALARRYVAFPLGAEDTEDDEMGVALAAPDDREAIEAIEQFLGRRVRVYVAPELRIYYYLEKHFNLPRKARFLRIGSRRVHKLSERRTEQSSDGLDAPPVLQVNPKGAPPHKVPSKSKSDSPLLGLSGACQSVTAATHRDQIADALLQFANGRFHTHIIFVPRGKNATGWRTHSVSPNAAERIDKLSIPLGGTSCLQIAFDSRTTYHGPPPSPGAPAERQIWDALGISYTPADLVAVPVCVRNRVVNLLYAHADEDQLLDETSVRDLGMLAELVADAYIRLIRSAKVS